VTLGAQASNLEVSRVKAERVCHFPQRPSRAPGRRPDAYKASALPVELQGRSTLGGSRTRINLALDQARLPGCGTSAWSLWTDSNGLLRVTTPVLCRVSYRGVAAHRGFEPRLPDPESSVLPVGRMGIECGKVRKVRFERTYREV
jgi:hypothetical protein